MYDADEKIRKLTTEIQQAKLNSKKAKLYLDRGDIFFIQKDYSKAAEDYNKAFELDPTNNEAAEKRLDGIEKWIKES